MKLHSAVWIGAVLGSEAICQCSTVVNGLRFYTPDVVNREAQTAFAWCAAHVPCMLIDEVPIDPDGAYALTPSGEHALADLDVSGLVHVERDTKRVRRESR